MMALGERPALPAPQLSPSPAWGPPPAPRFSVGVLGLLAVGPRPCTGPRGWKESDGPAQEGKVGVGEGAGQERPQATCPGVVLARELKSHHSPRDARYCPHSVAVDTRADTGNSPRWGAGKAGVAPGSLTRALAPTPSAGCTESPRHVSSAPPESRSSRPGRRGQRGSTVPRAQAWHMSPPWGWDWSRPSRSHVMVRKGGQANLWRRGEGGRDLDGTAERYPGAGRGCVLAAA